METKLNFEEIAEKAYLKKGIDKLWDLPTKYAYLNLEILYDRYKIGDIKKEYSILEKKKIEKEFEENKLEYKKIIDIYKEYNENRINNSFLLTELEKTKDKDKMIEILLKITQTFIKDDWFIERNLQKIKSN